MRRLHLWLQAHPGLFDKLAAGLVGASGLVASYITYRTGPVLHTIVPLLFWLPVWYRSRRLVAMTYVTVALGGLALAVLPVPPLSGLVAAMVMTYSAAAYAPRWHARAALGLAVAGGLASALVWFYEVTSSLGFTESFTDGRTRIGDPLSVTLTTVAFCVIPLVICWLWGSLVRARLAYLQEALDRAERLERERVALAQVAVAQERARIAREMHDIVAHSLSVIVLQSDGAGRVLESDPPRARQALEAIGRISRDSVAEMRRLLGVLRTADEQPPDPAGDGLVPQPGFDRIGELVDHVRRAGLRVELEMTGDASRASAGNGLAGYRIVQEALTNTLKHGGLDPHAEVRLAFRDDHVVIEVSDDGRGAAARDDGAGHGLIGMRERAAAVGGRLVAGPRPGGGFAVSAWLPYDAATTRTATPAAMAADPAMATRVGSNR